VHDQEDGIPPATIRVSDAVYELNSAGEFTFGRAATCTVCLDPDDVGISRLAGSVDADGGTWWVVNRSARRALVVVDEFGFRSVLPPGRRHAVEGQVRIVVDGSSSSHELHIRGPVRTSTNDIAVSGAPTAVGEEVVISPKDRAALVALFAGYLEDGRRYDPRPKSYGAAAARLGWKDTTLRKRMEYLRSRLGKAGVPNVSAGKTLSDLAEYVLATKIITKDDLRLIYPDR
jgi:hypothetical protein